MAKPVEIAPTALYIDPRGRFGIGDVREETAELLFRLQSAADTFYMRTIGEIDSHQFAEQAATPFDLRVRIANPDTMTYYTKRSWRRKEARVEGFLIELGLIDRPSQMVQDAWRILESTQFFFKISDVVNFWSNRRDYYSELLKLAERPGDNTFNLGMAAYTETQVASTALHTGIYAVHRPLPLIAGN